MAPTWAVPGLFNLLNIKIHLYTTVTRQKHPKYCQKRPGHMCHNQKLHEIPANFSSSLQFLNYQFSSQTSVLTY